MPADPHAGSARPAQPVRDRSGHHVHVELDRLQHDQVDASRFQRARMGDLAFDRRERIASVGEHDLAARLCQLARFFHRSQHLGMQIIERVSQHFRQVGAADEDAADAVDGENVVERLCEFRLLTSVMLRAASAATPGSMMSRASIVSKNEWS